MFYYDILNTKLGEILISANEQGITQLDFKNGKHFAGIGMDWIADNIKMKNVTDQLKAYFAGELHNFDVKLAPEGTDFQKKVWNELLNIPFGETRSYKEIA